MCFSFNPNQFNGRVQSRAPEQSAFAGLWGRGGGWCLEGSKEQRCCSNTLVMALWPWSFFTGCCVQSGSFTAFPLVLARVLPAKQPLFTPFLFPPHLLIPAYTLQAILCSCLHLCGCAIGNNHSEWCNVMCKYCASRSRRDVSLFVIIAGIIVICSTRERAPL